ncbi:MAG: carbohydrate ABC transporter permease [Caldilineaceae bacterium]|nr:carbohydrate ABC transporter permease [Caldilineaceae bacterium]
MTTVHQSLGQARAASATFYARRRWLNRLIQAVIVYGILLVISFVFLLPFAWMLLSAVKSAQEVAYFPPTIIPRQVLLSNFFDAWAHPDMQFSLWLWNTVYISGTVLVGVLLTSSLCAYGFARIQFPGREFWFIATIASVMLPPQVTLIPLYVLFFKIGWLNTFHPLIIPAWFGGGALNIFLLRQFFLQIPSELEDAAHIDGAGRLHIWWRIFLPLSLPALLTVAIFTFQATWNDFYGPLIYLTDRSNFTLSLGMNLFNSQYGAQVHYMMAIASLMSLPMIIVFFVAQRYFIGGIVLSGVNR